MREQWGLHCTSQWEWKTPLSEPVYCVAVPFKMTEQVGQQICIKFCIRFEHSSTETIRMIQEAFRDDAMSAAHIKVWHSICWKWSTFWKACNKQNTWECWMCTAAINKDQKLTVWELEASLGIPKPTVSDVLTRILAETFCGKISSAASATREGGTLCCSC